MSSPPTGTVTFLFTDIEGSTRLAQAQPAAWPAAQARHHRRRPQADFCNFTAAGDLSGQDPKLGPFMINGDHNGSKICEMGAYEAGPKLYLPLIRR